MSRFNSKFEIGSVYKTYIIKKYGNIIWTPYDGETSYGGFIFTYEPGPRLIETTNKRAYVHEITLKDLIWVRSSDSNIESNFQLLVSASSDKPFATWYKDKIVSETIPGNTVSHSFFVSTMSSGHYPFIKSSNPNMVPPIKGLDSNYKTYNAFVENFFNAYCLRKTFSNLTLNFKSNEKKKFLKYVTDNNLTKEQVKELKAFQKKELLEKANEEKFATHLSKEMDMLSVLAIDLNTLIEECKGMQSYIANPDNRLNVSHYKTKVKKVKDLIKTIRRMKVEPK